MGRPGDHPPHRPRLRLAARALPRAHLRLQGRRAPDAPPAHERRARGERPQRHDRDGHLGRHGQGRPRRLLRRPRHGRLRLLPVWQGVGHPAPADGDPGRLERGRLRDSRHLRRRPDRGQAHLRRPRARRAPRRGQRRALERQLHQHRSPRAPGHLLLQLLRPARARRSREGWRQGRLLRTHGQLRRRARRLLRQATRTPRSQAHRGVELQRRPHGLHLDGHLRPQSRVRQDDLPVDGHPRVVQPRADALLCVRR